MKTSLFLKEIPFVRQLFERFSFGICGNNDLNYRSSWSIPVGLRRCLSATFAKWHCYKPEQLVWSIWCNFRESMLSFHRSNRVSAGLAG